MPIKGLTDRGLSFPLIGHIRKGAEKKPNAPGRDLSFFRVEFGEEEKRASQLFVEAYGDHPTWIRVYFPFDDIDQVWSAWLEGYTAGRLVARADGEKYLYIAGNVGEPPRVLHGEPYTPYVEGEPIPDVSDYKGKPIYCKPKGRLKVIVPELKRAAYLLFQTGSKHDIMSIDEQLKAFKEVNDNKFSGIPFILRRRPKEISVPRDDKMIRMTMSLVSIEADPSWVEQTRQKLLVYASPKLDLLPEPQPEPEPRPDDDYPWILDDDEIDRIAEGVYSEPEPPPPPEPQLEPGNRTVTRVARNPDGSVSKLRYQSGSRSFDSVENPPETPTPQAWKAWDKLVDKAEGLGIAVDTPPSDISLESLNELYKSLSRDIRKAEESID